MYQVIEHYHQNDYRYKSKAIKGKTLEEVKAKEELILSSNEPVITQEIIIEQIEVPTYTVEEIHKTGTPAQLIKQQQPKTQHELSSAMSQWKGLSEQPKETKYINTTIHYIVDDDDCPKKEEVIEPIETQHIERRDIPKDISEDTHKTGTPINVKQAEQIRPELSSAMGQWKDVSKQPKKEEITTTTTYKTKETIITYIVEDEPQKEEITTTINHLEARAYEMFRTAKILREKVFK